MPGEMNRHLPWPFPGGEFPDELGAVVQRTVLSGDLPALLVIHTDDNSWLVGDGSNDPNQPDAAVATHLHHVLQQNSSIHELAGLAPGYQARREAPGRPWVVSPFAWPSEPR